MKIKLKKGLDLDIQGAITPESPTVDLIVERCAIIPDDFPGFIPKLDVAQGDTIAAGDPIFHDKIHRNVHIVAPIAGRITEIVRGERRKIERVVIQRDPAATADRTFDTSALNAPAAVIELLCASGMIARMRQRPYDIVPNPEVCPRDIFVTAMDTAPLSPGLLRQVEGGKAEIAEAVRLLTMLTPGKIYISHNADWQMGQIPGAEMVTIEGAHPAGNVGIQIANIAPVNKGETVWTLDIVTLYKIGRLALTGNVDSSTLVAQTGAEVITPRFIRTIEGAPIEPLIAGNIKDTDHHQRIISGSVLTGVKVSPDGYLHFPYRQMSVIPEGDDVDEFMGWASLSPRKMSVSRSFPGHFFGRKFNPDARLLGGRRAMIMSGEYDRVLPMDILPEYLLKAIISRNIEDMERLGIYEVAPEDFALCEYVDTSKLPIQQIVRQGLDFLRKELS